MSGGVRRHEGLPEPVARLDSSSKCLLRMVREDPQVRGCHKPAYADQNSMGGPHRCNYIMLFDSHRPGRCIVPRPAAKKRIKERGNSVPLKRPPDCSRPPRHGAISLSTFCRGSQPTSDGQPGTRGRLPSAKF